MLAESPGVEGSRSGNERFNGTQKHAESEFVRIIPPAATLERVRRCFPTVGITRIANLTGLDRIGIPVVAVVRPNSRSYSVAQGKGVTLDAAKASGVMEAIEHWHAEQLCLPLRLGSVRELCRSHQLPDVAGLPKLATSTFTLDHRLLWVEGGIDLVSGEPVLLPYELVHLDLRLPLPQGTGAFLINSNGLASGNHPLEALSHALCELIERDANTLWNLSGERVKQGRRIDLDSVDDPVCRELLAQLDVADIDVIAWNTTTDIGVASILCDIVDRHPGTRPVMPAVMGSGCHPCRRIALSRALTEAVQGRLTRISGSRDDLFNDVFDEAAAQRMAEATRRRFRDEPRGGSFLDLPNVEFASVEEDVRWICAALQRAGMRQILTINLSRSDVGVSVVRVIVPQLEAMSEQPGYTPGARGLAVKRSEA